MSGCFSSPCCGYEVIRTSSKTTSVPRASPSNCKANDTNNDIYLQVSDDEIIESVFERAYYTVNQLTSSISPWMMAPTEAKTNVATNYLYKVIESRSWDAVLELIQNDPSEAATWITREENHSWKLLPIHAAIIFKAPEFIIEALLQAYPDGALEGDNRGMTPLHLAFRHAASDATLYSLLNACPTAIGLKDKGGRTPLERHRTLFIPSNRDHSLTKKVSGIAKYVSIATKLEKDALELQLNNSFNARLKRKDDIISKLNSELETLRIEKHKEVSMLSSNYETKLQEKDAFIESLIENYNAKLKAKDGVISQRSDATDVVQERQEAAKKKRAAMTVFSYQENSPIIRRSPHNDASFENIKLHIHEMKAHDPNSRHHLPHHSKQNELLEDNTSIRENDNNDGISYGRFIHNHYKEAPHHGDLSNKLEEKIIPCVEKHSVVQDHEESSATACPDKYDEELQDEVISDRDRIGEEQFYDQSDVVETEPVFDKNRKGVKKHESSATACPDKYDEELQDEVISDRDRIGEEQFYDQSDVVETEPVFDKNRKGVKKHALIARLRERHNTNAVLARCYNNCRGLQYRPNEKLSTNENKGNNMNASFCDCDTELPVFTAFQNQQEHSVNLERKKPNEWESLNESFNIDDLENILIASGLRSNQQDEKKMKVGMPETKVLSKRLMIMEQLRHRYAVRPVFAEVQNHQRPCQMTSGGNTDLITKTRLK
jgi:hypothetical protein